MMYQGVPERGLIDRQCDESLSETPNQSGSSSRGILFFAENVLQMYSGPDDSSRGLPGSWC